MATTGGRWLAHAVPLAIGVALGLVNLRAGVPLSLLATLWLFAATVVMAQYVNHRWFAKLDRGSNDIRVTPWTASLSAAAWLVAVTMAFLWFLHR